MTPEGIAIFIMAVLSVLVTILLLVSIYAVWECIAAWVRAVKWLTKPGLLSIIIIEAVGLLTLIFYIGLRP